MPFVLLGVACADRPEGSGGVVHPTLVGVSPDDFLGEVPCLDAEGAMRSYVATLFDVTKDLPTGVFELPSSSLISCRQDVAFSYVVPQHRYTARIQGYDRSELQKLSPGSPHAVDRDGRVVAPRWTTECGGYVEPTDAEGAGGAGGQSSDADELPAPGFSVKGVTSAPRFTVNASYCLPLVDHGPESETRVSVGLEAALRQLRCGEEPGEVFEFSAELEGSSLPPARAACDGRVSFPALAGQHYRVVVLAFEQGAAAPSWQTTCRATALKGAETPANCDALSPR